MENENTPQERQQINLDEAMQHNAQAIAESQANSPFVKIQNHETIKLPFLNPPIIFKRTSSGIDSKTQKPYTSEQLEFELRAKTPDGQTKSWSIGAANKIVPEILAMLKSGVYDISVHREGEGINTKYSIAKERVV